MATHSSVLAWRIPGTEKPGGLPSMGSHSVGVDWSDLAAAAAAGLKRCPLLTHTVNLELSIKCSISHVCATVKLFFRIQHPVELVFQGSVTK